MHAFQSVILGIVEGITEFLPVSSTGHLILASGALRIPQTDFVKSFEIFIQLGAILAVFFLYWKRVLLNKKVFMRVAVAFLPTAIVGLTVYRYAKKYLLGNMSIVLWALALGGALLVLFELLRKDRAGLPAEVESISYGKAFVIGLFQTLAIIPGVSRSAATIVGGLLLGVSRTAIVEFSFMLAIPTMAAAVGLDLIQSGGSFSGSEKGMLAIGFVTAFISALLAVKFLLRYIKTHTFVPFGIYRIVIAVAFALYVI